MCDACEFMSSEHPVSPHLQIYRLPMAAVLSISHRITGTALSGAAVGFAFLFATAAYVPDVWNCAMALLQHPLGTVFLILLSFALAFHLCTGIRHLVWDTATGLEMAAVRASNWLVLAGATGLTAALWLWIAL